MYLRNAWIAPATLAEREANKTPERGICPPTFDGFERLAALSKGADFKISKGACYASNS
nr:MAG TPA: hypothetical protein [Caudoviricetes sp.]